MEIRQHKQEFDRIIKKYNLAEKADEIADFLMSGKKVPVEEFADKYKMTK